MEVPGLGENVPDPKSGPQDRVVPGEAAVLAVVDTLVGKVERGEEPHGAAEMATGEGRAFPCQPLEAARGRILQESLEAPQKTGLRDSAGIESGRKTHLGVVGRATMIVKGENCPRPEIVGLISGGWIAGVERRGERPL